MKYHRIVVTIMIGCLMMGMIAQHLKAQPLNRDKKELQAYTANLPFTMPELQFPEIPDRSVTILEFGAVGDGLTMNTRAFAEAIQSCAKAGGGHVVVPSGLWLTGPIQLASKIDLHLERGAMILFSKSIDDFPVIRRTPTSKSFRYTPPISGFALTDIAITGEGVIDGSGEVWRYVKKEKYTEREWKELIKSGGVVNEKGTEWWPSKEAMNGEKYLKELQVQKKDPTAKDFSKAREFLRPDMVEIVGCTRVLLDGPTFRNSPRFNIHPMECEHLIIRNITVRNPWNAQNGDGIDIASSHQVLIYKTVVDVGDDGICLKPGGFGSRKDWKVACENIVIADCIVYRAHGGFVIGSESYGGTRNVSVRNCTFIDTDIGLRFKTTRDRGGITEKIYIDGIRMKNIATDAILFDYYYEEGNTETRVQSEGWRKQEPVTNRTPYFRDFSIRNIVCTGAKRALAVFGVPESPIKNITLTDVTISAQYGAFFADTEGWMLNRFTLKTTSGPAFAFLGAKNMTIKDGTVSPSAETGIAVLDDETNGIVVNKVDLSKIKVPVFFKEKERKGAVTIQ
ncbi:MAG: glycoside hydrolase family 28 protein [bacterium]